MVEPWDLGRGFLRISELFQKRAPTNKRGTAHHMIKRLRLMDRASRILTALTLVACTSGSSQPFTKSQGEQGQTIPPPTDYYTRVSSATEKEVDYETLYGPGQSGPTDRLQSLSHDRLIPGVQEELGTHEHSAKPENASDRQVITAVCVLPVTGSTPNRNKTLALSMGDVLVSAGWPVARQPRPDALMIKGVVAFSAVVSGVQKMNVLWTVSTFDGQTIGRLEQSNIVPAQLNEAGWDSTARAVTTAAAEGIFELVSKFR